MKNIRSISVRNVGLNSKVERLHGTIREREKVIRGMQTRETSQKIIEAIRIHYNYLRVHSTIKRTPSEKARNQLDLQGNRIENLIRLSTGRILQHISKGLLFSREHKNHKCLVSRR